MDTVTPERILELLKITPDQTTLQLVRQLTTPEIKNKATLKKKVNRLLNQMEGSQVVQTHLPGLSAPVWNTK